MGDVKLFSFVMLCCMFAQTKAARAPFTPKQREQICTGIQTKCDKMETEYKKTCLEFVDFIPCDEQEKVTPKTATNDIWCDEIWTKIYTTAELLNPIFNDIIHYLNCTIRQRI